MSEVDSDLQGLLSELELEAATEAVESEPESESLEKEAPIELPVPVLVDPDPPPVKAPDSDLLVPEDNDEDQIINIRDFIIQHSKDYEETKNNIRVDRAKVDEVFGKLLERVEKGKATNQETESLVQAAKCLIESNGHMVKLLDSKSKLMSASKGTIGTFIQQNFGDKNTNIELESLLGQTPDEDEV